MLFRSQLSMIPWDYNLAYGTFQSASASEAVNTPIDTPVSGGDSRPMVDWIFDHSEYAALYHQYFQEFLDTADIAGLISRTAEQIAPYVEKDPTRFYSFEEFETGVETLQSFCRLRAESVEGQLEGTIPSTEEGQTANASALVDASSITLSDMGTMNQGGGPGGGGQPVSFDGQETAAQAFPAWDRFSPGQPKGNHMESQSPETPPAPQDGSRFPAAPGASPDIVDKNAMLLSTVSIAVLLSGLLFAVRFRRRKR